MRCLRARPKRLRTGWHLRTIPPQVRLIELANIQAISYRFIGIPYHWINPNSNVPSDSRTFLSYAGGQPLEYIYLSGITGNTEYKDRVMKIRTFFQDNKDSE